MRGWWLFAISTCAPASFTPSSSVDTLRVLAVEADKPIASPGETVVLRALIADPAGSARGVSFSYATCTNPGSGEIPDCAAHLGPMQNASIDADGNARFTIRVPDDALAGISPDLPVGTIGVVFAVCAGTFVNVPRQTTAPIGCIRDGSLVSREGFMWGMKRITVIVGARNRNPEIARVFFDQRRWDEGFEMTIDGCPPGDVSSCPPARQHSVVVQLRENSAEPYLGRTEDIVTYFFSSQGALRDDVVRSPSDLYETIHAPVAPDPTRPVEMWFVVRDDRGGTSFTKRTARFR